MKQIIFILVIAAFFTGCHSTSTNSVVVKQDTIKGTKTDSVHIKDTTKELDFTSPLKHE